MCAGAGVGDDDHIALAETATQIKLEGVVPVVACVLQDEVAAGQVVRRVVDKVLTAAALQEFGLQEERCREFLFECGTPVQEARRLEALAVNKESGENRRWSWDDGATEISGLAGRVEEVVLPFSGIGARDEDKIGGVVDDAHACGELGVAGIVQDVSTGEARGEQRVADDFIPIETQAGFEKEAVSELVSTLWVVE